MARRYRGRTVSVEVDVDVDDILFEVSDDDLLELCAERKLNTASLPFGDVEKAYDDLRRGDIDEALLRLERLVRPKWRTLAEAETALQAARTS